MRRKTILALVAASAILIFAACEIDPDVDLEPFDLLEPADNTAISLGSDDVPVLVDFEPTEAPPFMRNYDITYHLIFGPVNADLTRESQQTVGAVVGGRSVVQGEVLVDDIGGELNELQLRGMASSLGFTTGDTARIQWTVRAKLTSLRFEGRQYASTSRVLEFGVTAP